jgi:NADH:ubiquinone oxidoreductase subunit E
MVTVEICIGSACYVKGSSQVVTDLKDLIAEKGWADKVELRGSFCMKSCQKNMGLGVRIDGRTLSGITAQNAKEVLAKELSAVLS